MWRMSEFASKSPEAVAQPIPALGILANLVQTHPCRFGWTIVQSRDRSDDPSAVARVEQDIITLTPLSIECLPETRPLSPKLCASSQRGQDLRRIEFRVSAKLREMGMFGDASVSVKQSSSIRPTLMQGVSFACVIAHSFIIWQGLILATGTQSPIVVVLSASMEPAFKKGDIVFLHNSNSPIRNGEIVVYQLAGRDIPIIHRVVSVHEKSSIGRGGVSAVEVLTKGDHNSVDDRGLFHDAIPGLRWLGREHIIGRAVGFLPSVGWATLVIQDYPVVKYTVLPALAVILLALGLFES